MPTRRDKMAPLSVACGWSHGGRLAMCVLVGTQREVREAQVRLDRGGWCDGTVREGNLRSGRAIGES